MINSEKYEYIEVRAKVLELETELADLKKSIGHGRAGMNSITESEHKYKICVATRPWLKIDCDMDVKGLARAQIEKDLDHFSILGHDCMITEFPQSSEYSGAWRLYSLGEKAKEYRKTK